MFINEFENSNEYKLQQIVHTLKSIHGVELKLDEKSESDLAAMRQSSEIIKNSIVSESQFNTYNNNPEYTKHSLIMEAVKLYLTEIAPKRQKKTKVKENAVPSTPSTPSIPSTPSNGSANTAPPPGSNATIASSGVSGTTTSSANSTQPGMISVQKGNDKKTVPAAQLAALQSQGYTVVGDANAPVNEEGGDDVATDGHPADLEALMHKYGVEGGEVDEGMKEKIGGFLRRMSDKDRLGQSRSDVVAKKANMAYASGDTRKGNRYMKLVNKGEAKKVPSVKAPNMAPEYSVSNKVPPVKKGLQSTQLPTRAFGKRGVAMGEGDDLVSSLSTHHDSRDYQDPKVIDHIIGKIKSMYKSGDKDKAIEMAKEYYKSYKWPAMHYWLTKTLDSDDWMQDLNESIGKSTFDAQASMARAELYRNTKYAMEMLRLIRAEDDIQPWIASNLVKASEYLDQIFHYMDYYTKFEPENLPEGMEPGEDMDIDAMPPEEMGETTGSIARENLTMIIEYSTKLFNMIQPGDKLEGWVAMKLTSASNAISNSKHYLDYVQFEKHAGDHISDMASAEPIDEKAPAMKKRIKESLSVGQMLMKMMVNEDQDLAQAQALIAAKSLSDDLMTMAEKVSKMGVDDLMPLVDTLKDQFGPEAAQGYNDVVKKSLDLLLRAVTDAKKISDDAITQLQGGSIPSAGSQDDMAGGEQPPAMPGQDQAAGAPEGSPPMPQVPSEPLGRSRKEDELAEAWGTKTKTPAKKKGMWDGYTLTELKDKKKKLMDKETRTDKEQTLVKELNFAIRAKQKNKWGNIKETSNTQGCGDLASLMQKYGVDDEVDEGTKEKIGGMLRRQKQKDSPFQNRRDVAHNKAGAAYAAGDAKKGKRYLDWRQKSLDKDGVIDSAPFESDGSNEVTSDLDSLMQKYGVKGNTGGEPSEVTESKKLTERNKENAVKKKAVIDPKKRPAKKNDFDIRNMKPPFKKKPSDTIKIKEASKKAKPDFLDVDKDGDKKEPFKKALADKTKGKKKVDESAPPGKEAESFIKGNKENFAKRYGKKGEEVLYATAWKKFGKKSESVIATGKLLENHNAILVKLEQAFDLHKKQYAQTIKEGKHDDPLGLGYGLEGELLIKQMNDVKSTIANLKETLKRDITKGAREMKLAETNTNKISTISAAKRVAPWGVAWKSQSGRNQAKFFESQQDRDYWLKLKNLTEAKLINPEHFDREISKISSKKV